MKKIITIITLILIAVPALAGAPYAGQPKEELEICDKYKQLKAENYELKKHIHQKNINQRHELINLENEISELTAQNNYFYEYALDLEKYNSNLEEELKNVTIEKEPYVPWWGYAGYVLAGIILLWK